VVVAVPNPAPKYAYIIADDLPHLIRPGRPGYTLCKHVVVQVPELQPVNPAEMCPDCGGRAGHGAPYLRADAALTVECPVCGAEETPTADMTLPGHKEQRCGKSGVYRSDVDCVGAGQKPEADQ
jgi:hypothetical protein